jgi:hypothetical protein
MPGLSVQYHAATKTLRVEHIPRHQCLPSYYNITCGKLRMSEEIFKVANRASIDIRSD